LIRSGLGVSRSWLHPVRNGLESSLGAENDQRDFLLVFNAKKIQRSSKLFPSIVCLLAIALKEAVCGIDLVPQKTGEMTQNKLRAES